MGLNTPENSIPLTLQPPTLPGYQDAKNLQFCDSQTGELLIYY